MLPACTLLDEAVRLDVGRGVAVADVETRVASTSGGCRLDAGAALLAREEGRSPPELIVWRADLDGRELSLGGPRAPAAFDVPARGGRVRVRAVLRGERFVTAPLSTLAHAGTRFRATARSMWGSFAIAAQVHWTEVGVPMVATVDPARDHESMTLDLRVNDASPRALVIDAGPALGSDPATKEHAEREAELRLGGAHAVSIILTDLPLSIATAPDDAKALERLREAAILARVASASADPLLAGIGQRLTTAIGSGFAGCRRAVGTVPDEWPTVRRELLNTGVLDDDEAGCPRIDALLSANHASLRFLREGQAALRAGDGRGRGPKPAIGPLSPVVGPLGAMPSRARSHRRRWLVALMAAAALAFVVALRRGQGVPTDS